MADDLEDDFSKAAALVKSGNQIDAIDVYTHITTNPNATVVQRVRAYSNVSACYAARCQFRDALHAANEALELDDGNSKAHGRAATAYHGLKHYEEAAQHYERAHRLDPSNPLYAAQRQAVLALMRGGGGIATRETRDAFHYQRSLEHGKAAMANGEYLCAARHFGRALELHASCGAASDLAALLCNRSAARSRAGRHADALEDALRAAEVRPMYARAFFRVAHAQHGLGRPREAKHALSRCLELDPQHAEAAALAAEVECVLAESERSAAERQRVREEAVRAEREAQRATGEAANHSGTAAARRGPAHATSYVHCGYCNESGHTRAECPMLRRKRSRTE